MRSEGNAVGPPRGRSARPRGGPGRGAFEAVQHDFALSTRTVFYVMAGVMVVTFVLANVAMPRGKAA